MRIWLFAAAALMGTAAHFLYEPLGKPRCLVMFLPIGESPWEHVKLCIWPLLAAVAVLAYQGTIPWPAAVTAGFVGAMHAMAAMLGLHYAVRFGLRGGTPVLWVDIVTFFLSLASGYWIALGLLKAHIPTGVGLLSAACLLVLAVFFHRGSLRPPAGHLFQDLSKGSGNSYGRNQCTKSA